MTPPDEKNSKKSLNVFRSRSNFLTFPKKLFSKFYRKKASPYRPPNPLSGGSEKKIFAEISKNFLIFAKNRFFGSKKVRKASFKNSSENPTKIGKEMKKK